MKAGIKSIVVLTVICLLITAALAGLNAVTGPIIAKAEAEAAAAACFVVMPEAEDFVEIPKADWPADVPASVTGVFKETTGQGYAIRVSGKGYSTGFVILSGIGSDGTVTGTTSISSNETPSIGGACAEESYSSQYVGKTAALEGVNAISGATYSSNGYKTAVADAFAAVQALLGAQ